MAEEKSVETRKVWAFARNEGGTVIIRPRMETPGQWDGDKWRAPRKLHPIRAAFNDFNRMFITSDPEVADEIMRHQFFRTEANPNGQIWLANVQEETIDTTPIQSPAPELTESTRRVSNVARGTADMPRGTGR